MTGRGRPTGRRSPPDPGGVLACESRTPPARGVPRPPRPGSSAGLGGAHAALTPPPATDWGQQPRGVLTRDLFVRASQVAHGEGRALQFRVLPLTLALVAEAAGRLRL